MKTNPIHVKMKRMITMIILVLITGIMFTSCTVTKTQKMLVKQSVQCPRKI
jgi:hypothetical protein